MKYYLDFKKLNGVYYAESELAKKPVWVVSETTDLTLGLVSYYIKMYYTLEKAIEDFKIKLNDTKSISDEIQG